MKREISCDHCNVPIDVRHRPWDLFRMTLHSVTPREITLCRGCASEFIDWLDGPFVA